MKNGGVLVTDVTNASRTMLMDINTLEWSQKAIEYVVFFFYKKHVILIILLVFSDLKVYA